MKVELSSAVIDSKVGDATLAHITEMVTSFTMQTGQTPPMHVLMVLVYILGQMEALAAQGIYDAEIPSWPGKDFDDMATTKRAEGSN